MARIKSQKPLAEAPPDPESSGAESSSSTEDEAEEEQTPQKHENNEEVEEGEEEEEGEDDEGSSTAASSDDDAPLKKPQPKKPASPESSSDDEDDSPVKNLKPITSPIKPTTTTPATKPRSTPKSAVAADKRPLEGDDGKGWTSSKKPRKEKEKEKEKAVVQSEEGLKKQAVPFQRLFSEDDEIAILKGMIEYRTKKGADPMIEADDFYGFIKNSLQVDVNRGQFVDKVRRLKKRYITAVQKKKKLTNAHDILTFDLSKKIWDYADGGGNSVTLAIAAAGGGDEKGSNGVVENNAGGKSSSKRVVKSKSVANVGVKEEKKGKGDDEGAEKVWRINECDEKNAEFAVGEAVANEAVRKKGLRLMGAKARAEIGEMWEKVVVAQREVDSMRYDVQNEENRRILEAIKSGKSQAK